ncbi:hypothetical protein HYY71_01735 [Candidatus Woesearchaeota archaeon]|nr:hypothetical protein [Candidatus Woesearchaeota archaeon]
MRKGAAVVLLALELLALTGSRCATMPPTHRPSVETITYDVIIDKFESEMRKLKSKSKPDSHVSGRIKDENGDYIGNFTGYHGIDGIFRVGVTLKEKGAYNFTY